MARAIAHFAIDRPLSKAKRSQFDRSDELVVPENWTAASTNNDRGAPVVFGVTVNGTARLPGGTAPIETPGDAVVDAIENMPQVIGLTAGAIITPPEYEPPLAGTEIVLCPPTVSTI